MFIWIIATSLCVLPWNLIAFSPSREFESINIKLPRLQNLYLIDSYLWPLQNRYIRILTNLFVHSCIPLLDSCPLRSARSGNPIRKRKLSPIDPLKKKSKAKLVITTYIAFLKQYFGWPYLQPSSISLTTCRIVAPSFCSEFLFQTCRCQKIWLWHHRTPSIRTDSGVELKKPQWGGEGSFRHTYVAFRFGAKKKQKTKQNKKKKKKKKKKKAFRGSQQGCWSKFVVFALEQNFRK